MPRKPQTLKAPILNNVIASYIYTYRTHWRLWTCYTSFCKKVMEESNHTKQIFHLQRQERCLQRGQQLHHRVVMHSQEQTLLDEGRDLCIFILSNQRMPFCWIQFSDWGGRELILHSFLVSILIPSSFCGKKKKKKKAIQMNLAQWATADLPDSSVLKCDTALLFSVLYLKSEVI